MPPALMVVVDGFTRLGGSQYVDSIHNGAYATYVVRDVVGHVDRSYRTIAPEGGRAVLGKSSGGFGSLHLRHGAPRRTFAAFASHSGDSYFRYVAHPVVRDGPADPRAVRRQHRRVRRGFRAEAQAAGSEYTTMEMLGYASAYSPRRRGGVRPRPAVRLRDRRVARRRLRPLAGIRSGRARRPERRPSSRGCVCATWIAAAATSMLSTSARASWPARMRELGLEVRHEEFDDDHRNVGYRYAVSLPALSDVLER